MPVQLANQHKLDRLTTTHFSHLLVPLGIVQLAGNFSLLGEVAA